MPLRGLGLAMVEEYLDRVLRSWRPSTVRIALRSTTWRNLPGGRLEIEHLDINVPREVDALRHRLGHRRFDLLFVNAGVANRPEATTRTSQPKSSPG